MLFVTKYLFFPQQFVNSKYVEINQKCYDALLTRKTMLTKVEKLIVFFIPHLPTKKKNQKNGFFVECGALDGETRSNTLILEEELEWNGILIEADPVNLMQCM